MPPRGAGGRPVERSHARRSIFFLLPGGSLARRLAGLPRFFGRVSSSFFPCPPGGGLGGEPQARSSSFAFFFLGFCVARGGPRPPSAGGRRSSTPPRRVFSPSFFLFFPLAWQDRARVELAVKARSSSLGCRPFFPEALRRVLLLKAAANFTCQLLMPTCRELLHLPTSHANLSRVTSPANFSRVTSPANFSCQLVESYFTCLLLMSTFRLLSHSTKSTS